MSATGLGYQVFKYESDGTEGGCIANSMTKKISAANVEQILP